MGQAAASTKKLAGDLTANTDQAEKYRQGLDHFGSTAGKVGLVAAAGLGAAVVASANFDQGMSKVQAATGETAANMDRLRDAAIDAGASTAFSATEAAGAIENLSKAGVSTSDIRSGGLAGALVLAAAGEMQVADAAVRWGINPEHRARFGLGDIQQNTWQLGVQRLVLGEAFSLNPDVTPGQTELCGTICELLGVTHDKPVCSDLLRPTT